MDQEPHPSAVKPEIYRPRILQTTDRATDTYITFLEIEKDNLYATKKASKQ